MNKQEMLQNAVDSKLTPVYLGSRSAVLDYYQDKHGTAWKSHAAMAIAGTTDKSSRAYKTASRQFQMNKKTGQERYKGERVTKATQAKYEAIGKTLPPIRKELKGNSITITIQGTQPGKNHKGTRDRKIEITLTGVKAQEFVDNPTYDELWDEYGVDLGDDSDYALDIYSVG